MRAGSPQVRILCRRPPMAIQTAPVPRKRFANRVRVVCQARSRCDPDFRSPQSSGVQHRWPQEWLDRGWMAWQSSLILRSLSRVHRATEWSVDRNRLLAASFRKASDTHHRVVLDQGRKFALLQCCQSARPLGHARDVASSTSKNDKKNCHQDCRQDHRTEHDAAVIRHHTDSRARKGRR